MAIGGTTKVNSNDKQKGLLLFSLQCLFQISNWWEVELCMYMFLFSCRNSGFSNLEILCWDLALKGRQSAKGSHTYSA